MSFRDQIRQAWESGEIDLEDHGWDAGQVELEAEYRNEGSQTPPAKDRDGKPIDVEGVDQDDAQRVAMLWEQRQIRAAAQTKTAGEVRFIKDRGGDDNQWGWPNPGPSEREIGSKFKFNPTKLKPLASSLRASLMALGHAQSAYATFTKIKSATISPDGNLGGKGYIAKIAEMRRQYMNIVEGLSALTDTLYDELQAPHWNPAAEGQDPREREQVRDIMEDVEEIKKDPEEFAKEEEAEMDADNDADKDKEASKTALAVLRQQDPVYVTDLAQVSIRRVAEAHLASKGESA